MIKINIVAVGKVKEKYWQDAIAEYTKRLSRFVQIKIIEINEAKELKGEKNIANMLEKEGLDIIKAVTGLVVALDIQGVPYTSEKLYSLLDSSAATGNSEISFIIGGSCGLSPKVKQLATHNISFGGMTFPHQMMRVILLEQIYRAITIKENISYHK